MRTENRSEQEGPPPQRHTLHSRSPFDPHRGRIRIVAGEFVPKIDCCHPNAARNKLSPDRCSSRFTSGEMLAIRGNYSVANGLPRMPYRRPEITSQNACGRTFDKR